MINCDFGPLKGEELKICIEFRLKKIKQMLKNPNHPDNKWIVVLMRMFEEKGKVWY